MVTKSTYSTKYEHFVTVVRQESEEVTHLDKNPSPQVPTI